MNHQDWKPVSWDKRGERKKDESDNAFLNTQMRKGNVSSVLKQDSANKNKINQVTNAKKIDGEQETFKHTHIGLEVGKKISQARCEKKLSQEDLARALFLPKSVIQEFESGKAIYNAMIMNKLEKYLDKRFRK